jgi:DUF4097 and DUF4098 domain-containing protein YvlB
MQKENVMKRAALILMTAFALPAWLAAQTTVDQRRPAAPDGIVEIENPSGSVKVVGWDQAEVWVTGTLAPDAELDFEGSDKRTEIEIEVEEHPGTPSNIEVHVPAGSQVEVEGFNADIEVSGVTGTVEAETLNGRITHAGPAREVALASVNGSVEVVGASGLIQVEVVNGTVAVRDSSGELEASSVNGEVVIAGGPFEEAALESVAGDVRFEADLGAQGRLDVETVSGAAEIFVAPSIKADFSISTFSGEIGNELGLGTIQQEEYNPAKELTFSTGPGGARITVETLSGTVNIRKR